MVQVNGEIGRYLRPLFLRNLPSQPQKNLAYGFLTLGCRCRSRGVPSIQKIQPFFYYLGRGLIMSALHLGGDFDAPDPD